MCYDFCCLKCDSKNSMTFLYLLHNLRNKISALTLHLSNLITQYFFLINSELLCFLLKKELWLIFGISQLTTSLGFCLRAISKVKLPEHQDCKTRTLSILTASATRWPIRGEHIPCGHGRQRNDTHYGQSKAVEDFIMLLKATCHSKF